MEARTRKLDYGIDAPGVLRNLLVAGSVSVVLGIWLRNASVEWIRQGGAPVLFNMGGWLIFAGVLMLLYVKVGKFVHRDRMLKMISWRGDERVLDVGTGRGLLLIGAAKNLTTGRATGVDVWSNVDLSSNSETNTRKNIELEGVANRVDLKSEDVRQLGFEDGTFDVILSNLCLHNIPDAVGRRQACHEIARVLKPGGTALISDFMKTGEYVAAFRESGLRVERSAPYLLDTFPPLRVVRAIKPAAM